MNSVEKDNMLCKIYVLRTQVLSLTGELQNIMKSYSDTTQTSSVNASTTLEDSVKSTKNLQLSTIVNSNMCLCSVKEFVESNAVSRAKSLELRNIKLFEQVSEVEKFVKAERNNFENDKKLFQNESVSLRVT